ncbi:MAG: flavodoxin [Endomicrobiaceae bacterium]|nr:flavodoxin [Endomicrobiaceae bacterium]
MFKYLFLTISVVLLVSVFFIVFSYSAESTDSQSTTNNQKINNNLGKVLIIYYSLSGNTREIAMKIKEKTNADIYEIKTENEYPGSPMIYITAKKQMNPKNYPKLKNDNTMPDINQYDLIFVGGPVWWYTVPAPLLSFLSQFDFKGKTVVSFATHGGNYGKYFEDFETKIKNAKVIRGKEFKKVLKTDRNILDNKILDWLINLNI